MSSRDSKVYELSVLEISARTRFKSIFTRYSTMFHAPTSSLNPTSHPARLLWLRVGDKLRFMSSFVRALRGEG